MIKQQTTNPCTEHINSFTYYMHSLLFSIICTVCLIVGCIILGIGIYELTSNNNEQSNHVWKLCVGGILVGICSLICCIQYALPLPQGKSLSSNVGKDHKQSYDIMSTNKVEHPEANVCNKNTKKDI